MQWINIATYVVCNVYLIAVPCSWQDPIVGEAPDGPWNLASLLLFNLSCFQLYDQSTASTWQSSHESPFALTVGECHSSLACWLRLDKGKLKCLQILLCMQPGHPSYGGPAIIQFFLSSQYTRTTPVHGGLLKVMRQNILRL